MPETSRFQRSAITGSASVKIAFAFDFRNNRPSSSYSLYQANSAGLVSPGVFAVFRPARR
jgi:hypothetical protein